MNENTSDQALNWLADVKALDQYVSDFNVRHPKMGDPINALYVLDKITSVIADSQTDYRSYEMLATEDEILLAFYKMKTETTQYFSLEYGWESFDEQVIDWLVESNLVKVVD